MSKIMSEENLFKHTISHIRKIVLIIISLLIIYHSILHIESKRDTCKWLLEHGKLVAGRKWQPFGCLLNTYNKTDSKLCLRRATNLRSINLEPKKPSPPSTRLVFMGDTRLLQLYHFILEHVFAKSTYHPVEYNYSLSNDSLHQDLKYTDEELGLVLEFRWRPLPTQEMFMDFAGLLQSQSFHKKEMDLGDLNAQKDDRAHSWMVNISNHDDDLKPIESMVIVGHALWPRKGLDSYDTLFEAFKTNMTRLLTHVKNLKQHENRTKILWSLMDPVIERKLLNTIDISNSQIDETNDIIRDLAHTVLVRGLFLLTSHQAITKSMKKFLTEDGIHSSQVIIENKAQILLNFMFNRIHGHEGTCCSKLQEINFIQSIFILIAFTAIIAYLIQLVAPYFRSNRVSTVRWQKVPNCDNTMMLTTNEDIDEISLGNNLGDEDDHITLFNQASQSTKSDYTFPFIPDDLLVNLAKFSMAIIFMFICDRTNFFMKENKYFTLANFILPLVYVFALGLFFTEAQPDSSYSKAGLILGRNQTDEWKGWMQLVVLIYNLSSAGDNLRIYMLIRALISSYLFLTGFGHFTYFYKTGDTSIRRLCQIIVRLNLLVVYLCLCMNRLYQYYYFIPLVTFWSIIVYLTMKIHPIKNIERPTTNDHFWIIFKISIVIGLVTMLYLSEVFFERIFLIGTWRLLFITSSQGNASVSDWRHHWSVDRYSVPAGMIYALIHWTFVAPHLGIVDPNLSRRDTAGHSRESSQGSQDSLMLSNPLTALHDSIKPRGSLIITLALIGVAFYSIFAASCSDKSSCDEVHAYVSFVPIISYLILRNANSFLRNRHSTLFAFIGRLSLELSLCQYHIWLAAGQKGLLVLVPSNSTLNLVITSILFITTAHKLNSINRKLAQYALSGD